jgi:PadR family transcriptional regulator PadR
MQRGRGWIQAGCAVGEVLLEARSRRGVEGTRVRVVGTRGREPDEEVTGREVTIGAVYATLDRLEAKELVASERGETGAGSSRRLFAVTPRGARALADSREMRERLWRGVDLVPLLARGGARGGA